MVYGFKPSASNHFEWVQNHRLIPEPSNSSGFNCGKIKREAHRSELPLTKWIKIALFAPRLRSLRFWDLVWIDYAPRKSRLQITSPVSNRSAQTRRNK